MNDIRWMYGAMVKGSLPHDNPTPIPEWSVILEDWSSDSRRLNEPVVWFCHWGEWLALLPSSRAADCLSILVALVADLGHVLRAFPAGYTLPSNVLMAAQRYVDNPYDFELAWSDVAVGRVVQLRLLVINAKSGHGSFEVDVPEPFPVALGHTVWIDRFDEAQMRRTVLPSREAWIGKHASRQGPTPYTIYGLFSNGEAMAVYSPGAGGAR